MRTLGTPMRNLGWSCTAILLCGLAASRGFAQGWTPAATATAVMLSDLHFDPFHDPAKVPDLVKAPAEQWDAILRSPDSAAQAADFAAVQHTCHAKESTDTPYPLLSSALAAAKAEAPGAKFVLVSGDLIVHELDCRYRAALHLPKDGGDNQSVSAAFAEKATVFVMKEVEAAFPQMPVYLALGNNDSRCNHNRLDLHDDYLKATSAAVLDGLVGVSAAERAQARETYESAGYYAVAMAAPMRKTRLLVLDDTYMMAQYANCEADARDRKGADEQIEWLGKQLDAAEQKGERVWVLGHVPPSVNPQKVLAKGKTFCAAAPADSVGGAGGPGGVDTLLRSDDLANALASHAGTIALAVFGHTHMDELHLVGTPAKGVPVKVVASVSPVTGNLPSFTVGKVALATSQLQDYTVFIASNSTGAGTAWAKEYSFGETYRETGFSAASLGDLIGKFRADAAGTSPETLAYEQHFFKGGGLPALALAAYWQGYVCSLDQPTGAGFKNCVCAAPRPAAGMP